MISIQKERDLSLWNFKAFGESIAVTDESGRTLSYKQLLESASRAQAVFSGRSLCLILCRNSFGSIIAYTSTLLNQQVAMPLNAALTLDKILELVRLYRPEYIFAPDDATIPEDSVPLLHEEDYILYRTPFSSDKPLHPDLAVLLSTSGSTGSPKYVRQSYANIKSNTEVITDFLEIDSSERPITVLPMYYTFGLSVINTHLYAGANILLTDKGLMQKEFWNFLKDKQATSISGVPYTFEMLDMLRFYRMDLPYLKTITQAGGHLDEKLHRKFADYAKEKGKRLFIMYGQCEATARMSYLAPDETLRTGSIGKPLKGGCFELKDSAGNTIKAPDTAGELFYRGPNVTLGYANGREDLSLGDEFKGTLDTGDIAKFDKDGFYYIVGRKERFLKLYGNRVNLNDIDSMIKKEFPALEFATSGRDDNLVVFVTANKTEDSTLRDFLAKSTGINRAAFKIREIREIPRSESGKILYGQLNSLF